LVSIGPSSSSSPKIFFLFVDIAGVVFFGDIVYCFLTIVEASSSSPNKFMFFLFAAGTSVGILGF
jgi:hypothetical protein